MCGERDGNGGKDSEWRERMGVSNALLSPNSPPMQFVQNVPKISHHVITCAHLLTHKTTHKTTHKHPIVPASYMYLHFYTASTSSWTRSYRHVLTYNARSGERERKRNKQTNKQMNEGDKQAEKNSKHTPKKKKKTETHIAHVHILTHSHTLTSAESPLIPRYHLHQRSDVADIPPESLVSKGPISASAPETPLLALPHPLQTCISHLARPPVESNPDV